MKIQSKKSAFDMVDIQRTRKDVNNVLEKNPLTRKQRKLHSKIKHNCTHELCIATDIFVIKNYEY